MQPMRKIFAISTMFMAMLSSCDDPGEGERFQAARRQAEPIVFAINSYRNEHGFYPSKIDDLVPKYFSKKFIDDHVAGKSVSFFYQKTTDDEFIFEFIYTGPGRNRCGYVMDSKPINWECWGHY